MADTVAPAQDSVNVINPDGQLVSIPSHQLPDAMENGYSSATNDDVAKFQRQEKYGSTAQQIGAGVEGALSTASFGLSTGLEKEAGEKFGIDSLKPEAIRARREENPGSHALGQVAGLVGGVFLAPEMGAAALMGKAGGAAAEAIGLGAQGAGVLSRVGSAGVKAAVENMLFQGGDEVSKMLSSDPSQSVDTALVNVGLSGLIGGGIGAALGTVSPLWNATAGKKMNGILQNITNEAEGTVVSKPLQAAESKLNGKFTASTPEQFIEAKNTFIKNNPEKGKFLSPSTAQDLQNHKLFVTGDNVGYALSPEGDLQQVFNGSGKKGAGQALHARRETWL